MGELSVAELSPDETAQRSSEPAQIICPRQLVQTYEAVPLQIQVLVPM